MKCRRSMFVISFLALVLFAPALSAGQGKNTKPLSATVEFLEFDGARILGGPVDGAIYVYPGSFSATAAAPLIRFLFTDQTEVPPTPNCRAWGKDPSYNMSMPPDVSTSASVFIHTYSEFEFIDDGDGVDEPEDWQEVTDDRGRGVFLNLLELGPGQKAYVQVVFRLTLATTNDFYDVNFNRTWDAPVGWNGGIFEVAADGANEGSTGDTYYFRPLDGQSHRPPYLEPDQVNLRLIDNSDGRRDPGGVCTLGHFYMPFEMVVTRK